MLGSEHINLTGDYIWGGELELARPMGELRPLRRAVKTTDHQASRLIVLASKVDESGGTTGRAPLPCWTNLNAIGRLRAHYGQLRALPPKLNIANTQSTKMVM